MDKIKNEPKYGKTCPHEVEAIYSEATLKIDCGNIYIEALPEPFGQKEMNDHYYLRFPLEHPTIDGDPDMMAEEVGLLREIRLPLSFNYSVERAFRGILLESYRARRKNFDNKEIAVWIDDQEKTMPCSFRTASGADGNTGFSLLGVSGCGKSTAIEMLLSHYPQVIKHHLPEGDLMQIVWLRIVTPVNGNLSDTYEEFARAIDEAVGNTYNLHYAKEMHKRTSVGAKAAYLATLINTYGVGALVLDEVQNMNFSANKQASFESFLTVTNTTKVGLVTVGTEEAFAKLYSKNYTARRTGTIISASDYCTHRDYFDKIAKMVMSIQWFKEPVPITKQLLDAMYAVSSGAIDRIISVWTDVQLDYIYAKEKPLITGGHIMAIANKTRPMMDFMTRNSIAADPLLDSDIIKVLEDENRTAEESDQVVEYTRNIEILTKGVSDKQSAIQIFKTVKSHFETENLLVCDSEIAKAVNLVCTGKKYKNYDQDKRVAKSIEKIRNKNHGTSFKKKTGENDSPDTEQIRFSFLNDNRTGSMLE